MIRYPLQILPAVLLALACLNAAGAEEQPEEVSLFPVYLWLDAYDEEPADYAYWETSRRRWYRSDFASFGETGTCCPSVMREAGSPGRYSVAFYFYNEQDRLIRSATDCLYVDEHGFSWPCDEFDGLWPKGSYYSRDFFFWSSSRGAEDEKPLIEYPWPEFEISVELGGSGPWTANCSVGGNIPDRWIQSFEWDLNNDGVFNAASGRSPEFTTRLTEPGKYIFSVLVTDMRGYTTTAATEFTVPAAPGRSSGWADRS